MKQSWKVLLEIAVWSFIIHSITGYRCIAASSTEKPTSRWTEAGLWYGTEPEILLLNRQSRNTEESSQRVIMPILHMYLGEGQTGVNKRRLSNSGRKNYT